ncbi:MULTISPECIES: hypothetical protein [Photorhabdus]|uniref:hypothetical protein n=1 Tax=Photorhabdus TaxID=29487 RepID=UPI00232C2A04|nr:hypothetical protein [Photorhabdus bodei]MDB6368137.1 hypothetical protein [Photorhabdus bodei]
MITGLMALSYQPCKLEKRISTIIRPIFLIMAALFSSDLLFGYIPVIFQVASLLAALTHPGHIVIYAPGDSLPCRRDPS